MKKHTIHLLLAACLLAFAACQSGDSKAFETPEGVADAVSDLQDEFGTAASYTNVLLAYHKGIGNTLSATGTKDPASKKMLSKQKVNGMWKDLSEVTLEIEGDAQPADFMFTLQDLDHLKKLPGMIKQSVDKIKKEKNFEVVAESVNINAPSRIKGPDDKLRYLINCAPPNGGTSFTVIFDHNGNFQTMVY